MDSLVVYNSENVSSGDTPNGKDGGLGSVDGISKQKQLAEITDLPCLPKSSFQIGKRISIRDSICQLQNENMVSMKILDDMKKLIESSRLKLHKVSAISEKVQLQTLQFAQANSQILKEHNLAEDSLKAMQHEPECENELLKTLHIEEKARLAAYQERLDEVQATEGAKEGEPQLDTKKKNELCETCGNSDLTPQSNRQLKARAGNKVKIQDSLSKRRSATLKRDVSCNSSFGAHDDSVGKADTEKKADNQGSRRVSKKLRLEVTQTSKNTSETTPVLLATVGTAQNDDSESVVKKENTEVGTPITGFQVSNKHSSGRPLRRAEPTFVTHVENRA